MIAVVDAAVLAVASLVVVVDDPALRARSASLGARPASAEVEPAQRAVFDPEAPPPRSVRIERLGIESRLVGLKIAGDGSLAVPEDHDLAGWFTGGTAPGDVGPAVIVGHVDSFEGPAVFYRLRELQPGDRVVVDRVDGSVVTFEVYGQETVSKDAFPTSAVYGATAEPELRLLTCGGRFDEAERRYEDNVVVYARQVVEPASA